MAQYNVTSMGDALKIQYPEKSKLDLICRQSRVLNDIPKDTTMTGSATDINLRVNLAPGRSADITQAGLNSADSTGPVIKSFLLTPVFNHGWKVVDQETILKAESQEGSYWEPLKLAAEDAMIELGQDLSHDIFRAGYGSMGTIKEIDGDTVTLTSKADAVSWVAGQNIVFSQSESGTTLRDSGDSLKVSRVNVSKALITFNAAVSNVSGAAVGDTMFIKGDRHNSATTNRTKLCGFAAYGPTDPVASDDSLFGVNRSVDDRLQMCVVDGSVSNIAGALRDGAMAVASFGRGTSLDKFYCSYNTLSQLLAKAESQILRDPSKTEQGLSFQKLMLNTPTGPVEIVADHNCQDDIVWGIKLNSWKLFSHKELVRLYNEDGLDSTRNSANGIELRYFSYANLACYAPGMNVRINLS